MLAYKFLRPGAIGPFSGFAWPARTWVTATGGVARCRAGIHGCRAADLPWWLHEELWIAEFADPVTEAARKVVTSRARLVERVDAWDEETSRAFAEACARRARDHAADDIGRQMASDGAQRAISGPTATAAYIAAHAARRAGGASAMDAERRWQSEWLLSRLGLAA